MKLSYEKALNLKKEFQTPLYIYDVDHMKNIMNLYQNNFKSENYKTEVLYASKAFCVKEMLRLVKNNGLSLDVVSIGELYTALSVGFDCEKIYFHGNNKSIDDLEMALNNKVGYIVVDNYMELNNLIYLCEKKKVETKILIRLNVGVEAHTHKFIVTAHVDSKFGVLYGSNEYNNMMDLINKSKFVKFNGFHSHIGSQIFDLNAFDAAIEKLVSYCAAYKDELVLNLGGGFGVFYTEEDQPIPFDKVSQRLINSTDNACKKYKVKLAKLCIEPGRSIVGEAGMTLYTLGYIKQTPNKLYYFIDGGMTDNIRPALYQAKYSADIIGKESEIKKNIVTIAGKCCESGDIIIENCPMPDAEEGDLLITYTTGAYGYSMSSNYNKALIPAVVFIEDEKPRLVVKRQTLEDLINREI